MNGRTNSAGGALVSDMEIPLDPCTDFVGVRIKDLEYLGKVRLTWTDPKDKYATPEGEAMEDTDQLVSKWSYTQIVRQADRAPVNPSDGVTVCTETTRNQYQTTGFIDTTAESNVTYYYAAYAFNEDGVYSEVISNGVQPVSFSTTLADNTWEEIDQACTLGLAESLWEIGDEKTFQYSHMGDVLDYTVSAILIAFNHDNLADGSGKAAMTFSTNTVMASSKYRNQHIYDALDNITTVLTNLNSTDLISHIKSVTKAEYWVGHGVSNLSNKNRTWFAFNIKELNVDPENVSTSGDTITDSKYGEPYEYFSIQSNRRKPDDVWTSTEYAYSTYHGQWINMDNGDIQVSSPQSLNYSRASLCPGFCIGKVAV